MTDTPAAAASPTDIVKNGSDMAFMTPDCAEALAGLARIYIDSGNEEQAGAMISAASPAIENHPEISAVRSMLSLKAEAPQPDEEEDVTAALQAAVDAKPEDLDARLALAKALAATGRNGEAVDQLLVSIEKNRAHNDEAARKFLLTILEAEGVESEVSIEGRRRLSSILFA